MSSISGGYHNMAQSRGATISGGFQLTINSSYSWEWAAGQIYRWP